jgi:hypothetical protein
VVDHLDFMLADDLFEQVAVSHVALHVRPATAVLRLWDLDIEAGDPRRILVVSSKTGHQLGPNLPLRAGDENSSGPGGGRPTNPGRIAFFAVRP